jgi:GH35 family endo-1,4-beta-xylanase
MQLGITIDLDQIQEAQLSLKEITSWIHKLNIQLVRIGIKWSRVEEQKGKYQWKEYDDVIEFLNSNNIPTILVLGLKSPRWPEFYIPDWVNFQKPKMRSFHLQRSDEITPNDVYLKERLFNFVQKCILRYNNFQNIISFQVENEPFFPFGPNKWTISTHFLQEEIAYIKSLTQLPILLTTQGLPTTGILSEYLHCRYKAKKNIIKLADIVGFNVFPKFESKLFGLFSKMYTASSKEWNYLGKWLRKAEKEIWITELQAEPWELSEISLKNSATNKTCKPEFVQEYIRKLKNLGIKTILLWGFEYHIACAKEGNPEWLELYKM